MSVQYVDIKRERQLIREASRRVAASKQSARGFLIEHGFLTKDGKTLAKRYRCSKDQR